MSTGLNTFLDNVTILTGATASRIVIANYETSDAAAIGLTAPGSLEAGTYTIEVSNAVRNINENDPFVDADFVTLNDGTADIGPPIAGKGRSYTEMICFTAWRIKKTGSVAAADIVFKACKNFTP